MKNSDKEVEQHLSQVALKIKGALQHFRETKTPALMIAECVQNMVVIMWGIIELSPELARKQSDEIFSCYMKNLEKREEMKKKKGQKSRN